MTSVHQIIPILAPRDAVGGHTLRVQRALRDAGLMSLVFAEKVLGPTSDGVHLLADFDQVAGGSDLLIYQASTGASAADWVVGHSMPFAVNHHNVTPSHFFEAWSPEAAANMRRARRQIRAMAARSIAGLADSPYNAEELVELGYRDVSVTPLLLDLDDALPSPDERTARFLRTKAQPCHWLFVGRLAPNKCQHDILAAFAAYRLLHEPNAHLTLVGSPAASSYEDALLALVDDLGIDGATSFVAGLSEAELAAYYDDADVFVCLSEHEGFCIPVIEAFRSGTPVVAFASSAVPDTAGAGAVLLPDKSPEVVAQAVASLLADDGWRTSLVAAGRDRVASFSLERTAPVFVDAILRAVGAAADG